jgi:hypothetical protein
VRFIRPQVLESTFWMRMQKARLFELSKLWWLRWYWHYLDGLSCQICCRIGKSGVKYFLLSKVSPDQLTNRNGKTVSSSEIFSIISQVYIGFWAAA